MKKVLVVDDETSCLLLYKIYLNREGINALCVDSPRTALELLTHETFDAIISDMCMPEMNGIEFLQSLRKQKLHQGPFIFVTGHMDDEGRALGGELYPGVSGVFGKPCPFSEVAALIEGELQEGELQEGELQEGELQEGELQESTGHLPAAALSRPTHKPAVQPSGVTEKKVSSGISGTIPSTMAGKGSGKVSNNLSSKVSNKVSSTASSSNRAVSSSPSIVTQKEHAHERAS